MSTSRSAMRLGFLALLAVVAPGSSQTIQPLSTPSSTPLPLPLAVPTPYNAYRPPFYPQQYPQQYPVQPYPGAPIVPPPQRYFNGPNPYAVGPFVPILQQSFDISPEGSYTFSYQSADGSQRQESGTLKYPAVPGYPPVMSVQGAYAAITPEGIPIEVTYLADENGYQPSGPGVHPAIQRAVAQQVAQAKQEQQQQPQLIK